MTAPQADTPTTRPTSVESARRSPSPVYLVSGASGAGKSTVGRALAQRFEYGVHIDADDVGRMVVSGARPPSLAAWSAEARNFDTETDRQLELRYRILCAMAKTYAENGFAVVVDCFFVTPWVDFCLDQLDGFTVHLVTLEVPRSHRHQRILERGTELPVPGFEELVESALAAEPRSRGLWIDASAEDPENVVDAILAPARQERPG